MSNASSTHESFPLHWPAVQPRKPAQERRAGRFQVSLAVARDELLRELHLLGASDVVISTNVPTRRDGLLYTNTAEPADPGVAIYFDRKGRPFVFACDTFTRLVQNLRAIGNTIAALRAIQRYGASDMLEQAFTGFAALPPAGRTQPWWEVLGVTPDATQAAIVAAYVKLVRVHHPDLGGSETRMAEINAAKDLAMKELGNKNGVVNGSEVHS